MNNSATIAELLIAIGTLGLAGATFITVWLQRQERKTAARPQLALSVSADRVTVRNDGTGWAYEVDVVFGPKPGGRPLLRVAISALGPGAVRTAQGVLEKRFAESWVTLHSGRRRRELRAITAGSALAVCQDVMKRWWAFSDSGVYPDPAPHGGVIFAGRARGPIVQPRPPTVPAREAVEPAARA